MGHDSPATERLVRCVRVDAARTVAEHLACPYCFGTRRAVAAGERARFCDYDPDRDPVVFGFPDGTARANGG